MAEAPRVQGAYQDKAFLDRDVMLDNSRFVNCRFERCAFVYSGGTMPVLSGCNFESCTWNFAGAAANTISLLSGLYNGGFAGMVEATFSHIRQGSMIAQAEQTAADQVTSPPHGIRTIPGLPGPRLIKVPKPE